MRATTKRQRAEYLFKYLLIVNFLQYLEAGAVPAMLVALSTDFGMPHWQQGVLGGVVYIALSAGGPCAGYLLKHFNHKQVVSGSVLVNSVLVALWASTPVEYSYSMTLFISIRFLMGLSQCVLCVFLPLWIHEFSPAKRRTTLMSYLQVLTKGFIYVHTCILMTYRTNTHIWIFG